MAKYVTIQVLPKEPAPGQQPEGERCKKCDSPLDKDELKRSLRVCPHCAYDYPLPAHERVAQLADQGSSTFIAEEFRAADPLEFFDMKSYPDRMAEAQGKTGLTEAFLAVLCTISGHPTARLGRIVVGRRRQGSPVALEELRAAGAMAALLREAVKPNLLQTLEGSPVLVHAGPFGNIAQGMSSVVADRLGLALADWVVTEAGFGADLGAEKFSDLKCRQSGLAAAAAVVVATVRALKRHGGAVGGARGAAAEEALSAEDPAALERGCVNLPRQIAVVRTFGPCPSRSVGPC